MITGRIGSRRRRWIVDLFVAALATGFLIGVSSHIEPSGGDRRLDVIGYLLVGVAGVSVVLYRRRPDVLVGVVTVVLGAYVLRRYVGGPVFVTGPIGLFFLSVRSTRRVAVTGAAVLCSVLVIAGLIAGGHGVVLSLVFVGWSLAAVSLGEAARNRRRYLTELEERARYLEHGQEEESRRRIAEDRLRIARDLHDSVAHAMATINVQAGAAAHVVDRRPEAAKEALTVITRASADVLDELTAMLRLLREDDESVDRAPTPGVEQIAELVAAMRDAHVSVMLEQSGRPDAVPVQIGTAAYRIVQESLTNVVRHAGGSPAVVVVGVDDGHLRVEVTDEGRGATGEAGAGLGIRGMRERAEATGGTLIAGPRPDGGFRVRADWVLRP